MTHAYQEIDTLDFDCEASNSLFTPFSNKSIEDPTDEHQGSVFDPVLDLNEPLWKMIKQNANPDMSGHSMSLNTSLKLKIFITIANFLYSD